MTEDIEKLLLEELRGLWEDVTCLTTDLAVIGEKQVQIQMTVLKLDEGMNGNGKPGLKSEVEEQGRRLLELEEEHTERKALAKKLQEEKETDEKEKKVEWRKLKFGALGLVIASIITLVINTLTHLLKFAR